MDLLIPCVPRGIYLSWNISVTIDTAHDATFFNKTTSCFLRPDDGCADVTILCNLLWKIRLLKTADFNTFSTQRLN